MDVSARARVVVREAIDEYAMALPSSGEVTAERVIDDASGHYELIYTGWDGLDRIHGSLIHIDIRGEKVYIEQDGTEEGIADRLVAAGIPRNHIVLAFKPPDIRPYTDFAAA